MIRRDGADFDLRELTDEEWEYIAEAWARLDRYEIVLRPGRSPQVRCIYRRTHWLLRLVLLGACVLALLLLGAALALS